MVYTNCKRRLHFPIKTTHKKIHVLCVLAMNGVIYYKVFKQNETLNEDKHCFQFETLNAFCGKG